VASVSWSALDTVYSEAAAVWQESEEHDGCPFSADPLIACSAAAGAEGLGSAAGAGGGDGGPAAGGGDAGEYDLRGVGRGGASTLGTIGSPVATTTKERLLGHSRLQTQSADAIALRAAAALLRGLPAEAKSIAAMLPIVQEFEKAVAGGLVATRDGPTESMDCLELLASRLDGMAATLSDKVARQAVSPFLQAQSSRVRGGPGARRS